jgi:arylsulfatase A-like enzyme
MEDYLACVASVDDNVGRLVQWLGSHGQLDDTVVVYGSDQGFFLGDHGWFDKRFMYEESIRCRSWCPTPAPTRPARRIPASSATST